MTKRQVRQYALEFKQSSAKLAATGEKPIYKTANDLGVSASTLNGWVKRYYPNTGEQLLSPHNLSEELKRLRKEVSRLKQERDILKKAAAYFASETL